MDALNAVLEHWSGIAGLGGFAGALLLLWMSRHFPSRREFEAQARRVDALEAGIARLGTRLGGIEEQLRALNEGMGWRFGALENQVTLLLRGHLDWDGGKK